MPKRTMKNTSSDIASTYVFGVSFFLIVIGIIYYRPSVFLFVPLLVSAFIMFLQSKVNRYSFAVGALNAILYAVAYAKMSLYAMTLYALAVSCPLQIITFFTWGKRTTKKETTLKKMSAKARLVLLLTMVSGWLLLYVIFVGLNSQYLLWDNTISILGIIGTILCMLCFKEYTFIQIALNVISVCTYMLMLKEDPSRIIWVISTANATICSCIALKNITKREKQNK